MTIEDTLRRTYDDHLGRLDLPPGDASGARRAGTRMRHRRRLTVGAAVAAVVAVAVGGTLIGTDRAPIGPSHPAGHWRELPAPPLSPRANAVSVWTGREVIVLGGETKPCPDNADCASRPDQLRDGAAYDPGTNAWRAIPPAPVSVGVGDRLVVAAGVVVLEHVRGRASVWYTYEPDHNRWSPIDDVPTGVSDAPSAIGPRVYVSSGRRVAAYDVNRFRWSLLPLDRIRPALAQRRVIATGVGPVVTGVDATRPNDGREPSLILADLWDGTSWKRLPPSAQLGNDFSWTGQRLVDPEPFTLDGGEVDNWGRSYPMGGTLDPATGTWGPLPDALANPPAGDDRMDVSASGGSWFAVAGQAYDDATGRVYALDRPTGVLPNSTAAWADDSLLVFGGAAFGEDGTHLTNRAWLWTP
jgi:hypothetical protein